MPLLRELEARVGDRRANPLARLADGLVGEPDDRERGQADADVGLHPHPAALDAVEREGGDAREAQNAPSMWSSETSAPWASTTTPTASKRSSAVRGRSLDLAEPRRPHAPDLAALGLAERVPRRARAGAARLDLAEHERVVVGGDEVELAEAGAVVAREHRVAEALEVLRGEALAEAAERVAGVVGHDPADARRAGVTDLFSAVTSVCRLRHGLARGRERAHRPLERRGTYSLRARGGSSAGCGSRRRRERVQVLHERVAGRWARACGEAR